MNTKLQRIAQIAKDNPKEKFSALIHHVNKEMLIQCHKELQGNRASGVDGISKSMYEEKLEENIDDLLIRMKRFSYRPKPSGLHPKTRVTQEKTSGNSMLRR